MADSTREDLKTPLLLPLNNNNHEYIIDIANTNGEGGGVAIVDDDRNPNPFSFLGPSAAKLSLPRPTPIDPFKNRTPNVIAGVGLYGWVKLVVIVPVALIRLAIFGLALAVGYLATKLALEGWKDRQNPMPAWRCRIMWITRICSRCILFSFGYHWIKRIGRPTSREIAPIVVSNHIAYIEPIFFFYELFPSIVASESHDSIPFVGTIIRAMQVIYVDRFSAASRKHAVNEIKRKASCNDFPRVLLFPEGTTTNGRALISFQHGAFIPGFPVQPVVVRYPHVHFDQSWGHISLGKLMFKMFTQFHNFMEVEYLPIIMPLESKEESAVEFAARMSGKELDPEWRRPLLEIILKHFHLGICSGFAFGFCGASELNTSYAMASALNVVQTSHSYGDLMLLTRASQLTKEKCLSYMVEMASVESLFSITTSESMDLLDQFFAMNPDSNGHVKIHGFLTIYELGYCRLSEKIFHYLDVEKKGSITFREFLLGSAHVRKQPSFWNACETAFNKCVSDCGAADHISPNQLGDIIQSRMPNTADETVHRLFHLLDVDDDGIISRDDFMMCLRTNPLLVAIFAARVG